MLNDPHYNRLCYDQGELIVKDGYELCQGDWRGDWCVRLDDRIYWYGKDLETAIDELRELTEEKI